MCVLAPARAGSEPWVLGLHNMSQNRGNTLICVCIEIL